MDKARAPQRAGDDAAPVSLEVRPLEASPCTVECPLGTNVKAYVSLIAAGLFQKALEEIRRTNPFPGICGRVCSHPCEEQCRRGELDDTLAIAALKRFAADYELRRGVIPRLAPAGRREERVAVIGSGPAGLTCAADLARRGYRVTVYEASEVPGGMLATGIPAYRLPRDILAVEIAAIQALGVDIRVNTRIGEGLSFEEVAAGHQALFIAAGAQRPAGLGIAGEQEVRRGLIDWVVLLREAALGRGERPGRRVVVVGGGDTAVDSARVALRLGADSVQLLYRRSREEMPARSLEVSDAEAEGVSFSFLSAPVRLLVRQGGLEGVECIRLRLADKDQSGRRRPIPVPGSEFRIPCDALIPAVGQQLDASFLGEEHGLEISESNLLAADEDTLETSRRGAFAGGDAISGPATVVDAIAAGQRAARSIRRYLGGLPPEIESKGRAGTQPELAVELPARERKARSRGFRLSPADRRATFAEIEQGLSETQAIEEAQRCLRCGPCLECRTCVGVCQSKQLILEAEHGSAGPVGAAENLLLRVPLATYRQAAARGSVSVRFDGRPYRAAAFGVRIDEKRCRGCGVCEEACEYRALRVTYRGQGLFIARVDEEMCRGCGACVSLCPSGALDQDFFSTGRIRQQIEETLKRKSQQLPVLLLACRWSEAVRSLSADTAAMAIEVMCLGRLAAGDLLRAFELGAAGALILGCDREQCHYGFGSRVAAENLRRLCELLELLGLEAARLKILGETEDGWGWLAQRVEACLRELGAWSAGLAGR